MNKKLLTFLFFCLAKTVNADFIHYGYAELKGTRYETMEDRALSDYFAKGKLFAIFDGHGGAEVSDYAKNNLIPFLKENMIFNSTNFAYELQRGIVNFDRELLKDGLGNTSGTTLCGVYVEDDKLYCANLGDSRAVLYGKDGEILPLSKDHKPQQEEMRIEKAGGRVDRGRVNGYLRTARALGDSFGGLKKIDELLNGVAEGTSIENFPKHPVSNIADVAIVSRKPEHEFIVIASDGLWDVMDNEKVRDFVKQKVCENESLKVVAEKLVEAAKDRSPQYNRDDISVIIVAVNNDDVLRTKWGQVTTKSAKKETLSGYSRYAPQLTEEEKERYQGTRDFFKKLNDRRLELEAKEEANEQNGWLAYLTSWFPPSS